jgi:hypothetical protein
VGKRWRVVREAPERCPVHGKSVHTSAASARAAARAVEVREGLEPGAMDTYFCAESKGWHIGHKSIRARLERD